MTDMNDVDIDFYKCELWLHSDRKRFVLICSYLLLPLLFSSLLPLYSIIEIQASAVYS